VALRCPDGTQFLSYWPMANWPLLGDCFLQTVQLLTVQVRIKSLAVEEQLISRRFPANPIKHTAKPSWLSILAGYRLRRLTAIRPRPFSLDVVMSDPLFITSHYPLQKWVDFVAIQQRFADGNSVHEIFLR